MHRHGYKGRKFHRETDQRRALMKSLADSLIENESIETTLPKAKELRPYIEKLVTKAKVGDLHNRRLIISKIQTKENAHRLVDEIAPRYANRQGGYVRIERAGYRRGDNAELAIISFVDSDSSSAQATVATEGAESKAAPREATKQPKQTVKKEQPSKASKSGKG